MHNNLHLRLRKVPHLPRSQKLATSLFFSQIWVGGKTAKKHASGYNGVKSEVNHYIQEPQFDVDCDPLEW